MTHIRLRPALLLAACATLFTPGLAMAGSHASLAAGACPPGTTCDRALGVALVPPAGWQRLPGGNFPPHTLAWFAGRPLGSSYNIRLLVRSDGTTSDRDDARAAAAAADTLVHGEPGVVVTRYFVRYGGAPGILIRGLRGGSAPDAIIILAHAGAIYCIIAPGAVLALDQRQALASLRFIPRVGPFPLANPPAPTGPRSHRTIPGGVFTGNTLTLTLRNGLHRGTHTLSLLFRTQKGWLLTYSVRCAAAQGKLVVQIEDQQGATVDRVLHRGGAAQHVRQVEEVAGLLRLDVQSQCSGWTVAASGITR